MGIAERIRNQVETTFTIQHAENPNNITVSIGISSYPEDGQTIAALLENGRKALAIAKKKGKNRVATLLSSSHF
jgi:diguanylate cyclase (GGDEF)-like protein